MGFSRQEYQSGLPFPSSSFLTYADKSEKSSGPIGRDHVYLFHHFIHRIWATWWLSVKESACQCRKPEFDPWVGKIPWRRKWQATVEFLPGESHGPRSLAGYSLWDHKRLGHNLASKQQQSTEFSTCLAFSTHPMNNC